MDDSIVYLKKVNIEKLRKDNPNYFFVIKRISETEAFSLGCSLSKIDFAGFIPDEMTRGIDPDKLEVLPPLIPDLSVYDGFDGGDIF